MVSPGHGWALVRNIANQGGKLPGAVPAAPGVPREQMLSAGARIPTGRSRPCENPRQAGGDALGGSSFAILRNCCLHRACFRRPMRVLYTKVSTKGKSL